MELQEAIAKRRSIRDFSDESVSMDIIKKALEAGLKAPSYNHLKQWDFILVQDLGKRYQLTQTEEMMEAVTGELEESLKSYESIAQEMYLDAIPKQKRMLMEAPELLAVIYKPKTKVEDSQRIYDLNCMASVWCCIENILLSLAEDEVFGVTFIPKNTAGVKVVLGVPAELEVAALIPFGYKKQGTKLYPQKEVDLNKALHINNYRLEQKEV